MRDIMIKYQCSLELLETQINILIKSYEHKYDCNPVEHVKSRLKSLESCVKKLEDKKYEVNEYNLINHVHDIAGIRIVCSFLDDVYNIVNLIKDSKMFEIKEEKDYIENPKESGYVSYHLIVYVPIYIYGKKEYVEAEIQIRTIAMDFWASLDHKIQYKFPKEIPEEIKEEMFNCSLDIRMLDNKMGRLNQIMQKYNEI